jgi:hypothetical protein
MLQAGGSGTRKLGQIAEDYPHICQIIGSVAGSVIIRHIGQVFSKICNYGGRQFTADISINGSSQKFTSAEHG